MGFVDAIKTCFSKYATFSGRATRSEYWWFLLFYMIISIIPLVQIAVLALIIPQLAVSWRRLHDIGKSGLWLFLPMIALPFYMIDLFSTQQAGILSMIGLAISVVTTILLIVWLATAGKPVDNRFGPPPAPSLAKA